jgi:hypothetical protein
MNQHRNKTIDADVDDEKTGYAMTHSSSVCPKFLSAPSLPSALTVNSVDTLTDDIMTVETARTVPYNCGDPHPTKTAIVSLCRSTSANNVSDANDDQMLTDVSTPYPSPSLSSSPDISVDWLGMSSWFFTPTTQHNKQHGCSTVTIDFDIIGDDDDNTLASLSSSLSNPSAKLQ